MFWLIAVVLVAGVVTYYYHLNEPTDQNDDSDEDTPAQMIGAYWEGGPQASLKV